MKAENQDRGQRLAALAQAATAGIAETVSIANVDVAPDLCGTSGLRFALDGPRLLLTAYATSRDRLSRLTGACYSIVNRFGGFRVAKITGSKREGYFVNMVEARAETAGQRRSRLWESEVPSRV